MYCAKCGKKLTEDMNFCPQCGAEAKGAASAEVALGDAVVPAGPAHAAPVAPVAPVAPAAEPVHADAAADVAADSAPADPAPDPATTAVLKPVKEDGATADVFPVFGGAAAASGARLAAARARSGVEQGADQAGSAKKKRHRALVGIRNCVLVVAAALLSAAVAYSAPGVYRDYVAPLIADVASDDDAATDADADASGATDSDGTADAESDASADAEASADAAAQDDAADAGSTSIFAEEATDVAEGANDPVYTYTYSQIYQAVTLTTTFEEALAADDAAEADEQADGEDSVGSTVQTTEATWSYPQFITTDGETTDALDLLNAAIVAAYESALSASENWVEAEATSAQTVSYSDTVASMTSDYVSIRHYEYVTYWGTHGSESVTGLFYDLSTGEQVEPAEALGFAAEELQAMATEAIYAYLASDESFTEDYFIDAEGTDAATLIAQAVDAIVTDATRYYATDDAIVVCTAPYELGDYSFGMQEIVIYAYTDAVTVGQAVGYGTN